MNIDFSPLPESNTPVKVRFVKYILIFLAWTVALLLLSMAGSYFNARIIIDIAIQTWLISFVLFIVLGFVFLAVFLFRKSVRFENQTAQYLSSFSYHNGWTYATFNEPPSSANPYLPPGSKVRRLQSYAASTLWTIDAELYEASMKIIGLRYFKHNIGPGHFAPHYMTVVRIPTRPYLIFTESKNVVVEHDNEYTYLYSPYIAITQPELKQLFNAIKVVQEEL